MPILTPTSRWNRMARGVVVPWDDTTVPPGTPDAFPPGTVIPEGGGDLPNVTVTAQAPADKETRGTYPTLRIATSGESGAQAVSVEFEYLPESLTFSTSSHFNKVPLPWMSAAQYLMYQYSTLEDVSVDVKVVAGCNNAVVNASAGQGSSSIFNFGASKSTTTNRVGLITIAQLLYSLTLPPTNAGAQVPPFCKMIIGPFCNCMGYVASVNIKFGGPYDGDGSPTEMDVSLVFTPTEYSMFGSPNPADPNPKPAETPTVTSASATMTGEAEATGNNLYAFWVGQAPDGGATPITPKPSPTDNTGLHGGPAESQLSADAVRQSTGLQSGPGVTRTAAQPAGTYSASNIAEAYQLANWWDPTAANNQVTRYQDVDPTTHQPVNGYFYDIGSGVNLKQHVPEATVNNFVSEYESKNGLTTSTTTVIPTTPPAYTIPP